MLTFLASVTIANEVRVSSVAKCTIESSWKTLSDTATVSFGNLSKQLERPFAVGDGVTIELGYNGIMNKEFEGFISRINPDTPYQLELEDAMFLLKREQVGNVSFKTTSLKELLAFLDVDIVDENMPDLALNNYAINNKTKAQVLRDLKDAYGIAIYFRDGELYAGLPFNEPNPLLSEPVNIELQRNVANKSRLQFRTEEDSKILIRAKSFQKDNSFITVDVGLEGGEIREWLAPPGITDRSQLEILALEQFEDVSYDGYSGSITLFGIPYCVHSQVANLSDLKFPERAGQYFIDHTKVSVDKRSGFRRELIIGRRYG